MSGLTAATVNSGTYMITTFTCTTPTTTGTVVWGIPAGCTLVDVLIVGAGGSGGSGAYGEGGGGAGGYRYLTDIDISGETTIDIQVGAGVAAATGVLSSFDTYEAAGGGCGASGYAYGNTGGFGGSGGGGTPYGSDGGAGNTPSTDPAQGYNGGSGGAGTGGDEWEGGGGGGSGGVGANGVTDQAGAGGIGTTCPINGNKYAGGGGGGGTGPYGSVYGLGTDGGGNGGDQTHAAVQGTDHTGSGGGGAGSGSGVAGRGGSGIVVVRYLVPLTVTTSDVSGTLHTSTWGHGNITEVRSPAPTRRGFCWNTGGTPTVADNVKDETGSFGTGAFTLECTTGMVKNTTYYMRAFVEDSVGISYGTQVSYVTCTDPTVTTGTTTDKTNETATGNGNITNTGGMSCSTRGICWKAGGIPTRADSHSETGGTFGIGAFTEPITGLIGYTSYKVRAYAINLTGDVQYGADDTFVTLDSPIVLGDTTFAGIAKVLCTATSSITLDGPRAATARGFCISPDHDPTISDAVYPDGTAPPYGVGSYSIVLDSLLEGTVYYVRSYATNALGTHYGPMATVTTRMSMDAVIHEYEWWKKEVVVTSPPAYDDYIAVVVVPYSAKMDPSFADVRFGDIYTGHLYVQMLQSHTDSTTATFYVVVPYAGIDSFHMFYGNLALAEYSDSVGTLFDHFDGITLAPLKWTSGGTGTVTVTGSNVVLQGTVAGHTAWIRSVLAFEVGTTIAFRAKLTDLAQVALMGMQYVYPYRVAGIYYTGSKLYYHGYTDYRMVMEDGHWVNYHAITEGGMRVVPDVDTGVLAEDGRRAIPNVDVAKFTSIARTETTTDYHTWEIRRVSEFLIEYWCDGALVATSNATIPPGYMNVYFYTMWGSAPLYVDWVAVYNGSAFTSNTTLGTEEENTMFVWREATL